MAEYLAPGVYVEETSFRAKSIEGVSTSTTGFVGMTRKGPYFDPNSPDGTPELLTSFGDFERIYGGLDDLALGPNYLAHAVRAYFDNGGSRLFVSRVFQANSAADVGLANSLPIVDGVDATARARFVARFPGAAGNGGVIVRQIATPATQTSIDAAVPGSMMRVGTKKPATMARLEGGTPPFALANDGKLLLTVGGVDVEIKVHGEPTEAVGTTALADPITIPDASKTLHINVDGVDQVISLPTAQSSLADLALAINRAMREGYARITGAADAQPGHLVIGSDRRGTHASVTVRANAALGFPADVAVLGSANPKNNVGDLLQVSVDEINALLTAQNVAVRATVSPATGKLVITTTATGTNAVVKVRDAQDSQNVALGLLANAQATGTSGTPLTYYVKNGTNWQNDQGQTLDRSGWQTGPPDDGAEMLRYAVAVSDADGHQIVYDDVGLHLDHPRWLGNVLAASPTRRADALQNPIAISVGSAVSPFALRSALFPADALGPVAFAGVTLKGGNDGATPNDAAYTTALQVFERIEDISIVAAPDGAARPAAQAIHNALITHVEKRRAYRIAVLDTPPDLTPTGAVEVRSRIDSTRAALYYPWVVIPNPLARPGREDIPSEIAVPPSGFVCGIYARNDTERGVFKAPANEIVRGALRFAADINFAQQEFLNPAGVNCLRFFPGRGYRLWGARTASSDPEWKYVSIRRYFNYLERSIDSGTQWVVFEPNGEHLWANVRETIASFLYNEWVSGALLGDTAKDAFFVRCDRSTMTQNDLDNGRLICLIGVAAVKPAEFVVFRIGQKTADSRA
jgi:Bacteriophage tail sheath protein